MSYAPSTGSSSGDLRSVLGEPPNSGAHKKIKDLIVNNYDYEWDQDDFFSKCCDDVVAAPWNLGKRLEKYHIMEVAWGSRQAVEITVGDILKKVRAHRWQNSQIHPGIRKSKVSEITYRDLAQLFSEVSLIPAFEIRRNCIVLCLPPLCCIVLHDRVMIHVNNAIQLDSLLLKLERLTLAYSKKAEETRGYFLRYYAPEVAAHNNQYPSRLSQGVTARSMLLTQEVIEASNNESARGKDSSISPTELPPIYSGFSQNETAVEKPLLEVGQGGVGGGAPTLVIRPPSPPMKVASTVAEAISNTYQSFPEPGTAGWTNGKMNEEQKSSAPWDTLHRMILSGNINLIQTIPRFVLFPLEFAFLEILISYAFGELNAEVNALDARTSSLLTETRSRVYNINLIDSLRDLKLMLHKKVEDISGIQSAFNVILDTPEDMAMMELTRLFYQSGYYYSDFMPSLASPSVDKSGSQNRPHNYCVRCQGERVTQKTLKGEVDINPNLEILLEFFSQEINLISTRVKNLLVNLQSAEKHINMIMSFRRNRFAMWDIGCGIVGAGLGLGAVISGTLGMNIPNGQEENMIAFPVYVAVIVASILLAFFIAWAVTNKTYI